jgi:hypothetical protein
MCFELCARTMQLYREVLEKLWRFVRESLNLLVIGGNSLLVHILSVVIHMLIKKKPSK